jgi:hypothetical protein
VPLVKTVQSRANKGETLDRLQKQFEIAVGVFTMTRSRELEGSQDKFSHMRLKLCHGLKRLKERGSELLQVGPS